jgi:hypothetical protein
MHLCIHPYICLSVHLSVLLSGWLDVPSILLSIHSSSFPAIGISTCVSTFLSVSQSTHSSLYYNTIFKYILILLVYVVIIIILHYSTILKVWDGSIFWKLVSRMNRSKSYPYKLTLQFCFSSGGGASIGATEAKPHLIFGVQNERRVDFWSIYCIYHLLKEIRQFIEQTSVINPLPNT